MTETTIVNRTKLVSLFFLIAASGLSFGQEQTAVDRGTRFELWLGTTSWPALSDLQPLAAGSFDDIGFGIGGAIHLPVKTFESGELLLGVDAFVSATESNIQGVIGDFLARQMFVGGSAKWRFGAARNLSLDAGIGFHLVDIAELDVRYWGIEYQYWETTRLGGFIGATWDFGMRDPNKNHGLFVGLEVHFVDFGGVYDEEVIFNPLLGAYAGTLDGPIYMLQIGYSGN